MPAMVSRASTLRRSVALGRGQILGSCPPPDGPHGPPGPPPTGPRSGVIGRPRRPPLGPSPPIAEWSARHQPRPSFGGWAGKARPSVIRRGPMFPWSAVGPSLLISVGRVWVVVDPWTCRGPALQGSPGPLTATPGCVVGGKALRRAGERFEGRCKRRGLAGPVGCWPVAGYRGGRLAARPRAAMLAPAG